MSTMFLWEDVSLYKWSSRNYEERKQSLKDVEVILRLV